MMVSVFSWMFSFRREANSSSTFPASIERAKPLPVESVCVNPDVSCSYEWKNPFQSDSGSDCGNCGWPVGGHRSGPQRLVASATNFINFTKLG